MFDPCLPLHTEKSFRNLIKSNRKQIVFTMHRGEMGRHSTHREISLNQTENRLYLLFSD